MDTMQIIGLIGAIMMLVVIGPSMLNLAKNSPKGSSEDWMDAAKPLLLVVGFVMLLFYLAKG
ncbi:MAG: hypothetical protein ACPGSC_04960 [Granulosicoccaceae bacterium]